MIVVVPVPWVPMVTLVVPLPWLPVVLIVVTPSSSDDYVSDSVIISSSYCRNVDVMDANDDCYGANFVY